MIEIEVLKNAGLSEKEALVYLALMELGKATAVAISKRAGIKRPTTYVVLDQLKKRGLVTEILERSRTLFVAESPEVLEKRLKQVVSDFSDLLPVFKARFNRGTKPYIRFYEGREVIKNLYIHGIFPAKKIFFYGSSIKKINEAWPDLLPLWKKIWWPKKKIHPKNVLEIVGNDPEDIAYAKSNIRDREVRILPKGKKFSADSVIADNKILITSIDHLFAVLIESEDLADTYRTLVELAWQSAIPADEWEE